MVANTLAVVDVEMSLMSESNDDELCSDDAIQLEPTKSDVELVPSLDDVTDRNEFNAADKTRLAVPTIVIKVRRTYATMSVSVCLSVCR